MIRDLIMKKTFQLLKDIDSGDRNKIAMGKSGIVIIVDDLVTTLQDIYNDMCVTEKFIKD